MSKKQKPLTRRQVDKAVEKEAKDMTLVNGDNIPVEASSTGRNAYLLRGCHIYQARHFCACKQIVDRHAAGKPCFMNLECNEAIEKGHCMATEYVAKEKEAGHAIFFVDRGPIEGHTDKASDIHEYLANRASRRKHNVMYTEPSYQRKWKEVDRRFSGQPEERRRPNIQLSESPKKAEPVKKQKGYTHADLVEKMMEEEQGKAK